jgi:hypothetical protein
MTITDQKPHRRGPIYCQTVFWNGDHAGNEDDATHVEIISGPQEYGGLGYTWPLEKSEVEAVERMLCRAFEYGKQAAKQEIRDMLGVMGPGPRR